MTLILTMNESETGTIKLECQIFKQVQNTRQELISFDLFLLGPLNQLCHHELQ